MSEPIVVDIREACQILHCGKTMLYAQVSSGKLRLLKLGRKSLIAMDDLRDLIDQLRADQSG